MAKRMAILVGILVILLVTGGLTSQIANNGGELRLPGIIRQVDNPDASALDMLPWKAEQLFLMIGFLVFNMVGIAVTLMGLMWFLNRQIKSVRQPAAPQKDSIPAATE
jgi:hypothetical protein